MEKPGLLVATRLSNLLPAQLLVGRSHQVEGGNGLPREWM